MPLPVFSPLETQTRMAEVFQRELFSPTTHVHPRTGSYGRNILVDGPAVQADEKEPSDLEGQRVIWDLALFKEVLDRLPGCKCGGHLSLSLPTAAICEHPHVLNTMYDINSTPTTATTWIRESRCDGGSRKNRGA